MQIFFMKNIVPITLIAFVLGAIGIGNLVQQKSIIETANAEDEPTTIPGGQSIEQESTEEPSMPPPELELPMDNPSEGVIENYELPEEMPSQENEPDELPVSYHEGYNYQVGTFPSGMQIIRTSFAADASEATTQEGPGPVEPPDPTDPHSERTGKHGGFKGQMNELPPVITMGEQPEDGGLTDVTKGPQSE